MEVVWNVHLALICWSLFPNVLHFMKSMLSDINHLCQRCMLMWRAVLMLRRLISLQFTCLSILSVKRREPKIQQINKIKTWATANYISASRRKKGSDNNLHFNTGKHAHLLHVFWFLFFFFSIFLSGWDGTCTGTVFNFGDYNLRTVS